MGLTELHNRCIICKHSKEPHLARIEGDEHEENGQQPATTLRVRGAMADKRSSKKAVKIWVSRREPVHHLDICGTEQFFVKDMRRRLRSSTKTNIVIWRVNSANWPANTIRLVAIPLISALLIFF